MSEIISCPSCQRKLQVPETLVGQDVQCPTCSATFVARIGSQPLPRRQSEQVPRWADERQPLEDRPRFADDRRYDDDFDTGNARRRRDLAPHRGAMILTLGIIGLMIGIPAPFAWIMGNTDMQEIRAGRMDPDGEGLTQAGRICGIIGTIFMALYFCCCGLMILGSAGGR